VKFGSGSKVTTPLVVFNVYVPSPATVSVVPVHEAATVPVTQIPRGIELSDAPVAAESLEIGVNDWLTFHPPVPVSLTTVGAPTTEAAYVEADACAVFDVTWYVNGVAAPWKGPVHDAPVGVSNAEHGVKVTTPVVVFSEYVPSPETERDVAVQFGGVSPDEQSLREPADRVCPAALVKSLARRFTD
jgi:hypothetical protein